MKEDKKIHIKNKTTTIAIKNTYISKQISPTHVIGLDLKFKLRVTKVWFTINQILSHDTIWDLVINDFFDKN